MKERLSKEVKKTAKNFALAYSEIKGATEAFEKWQSMHRDIDLERQREYELRKRHLQTIRETFIHSVNVEKQEKVWNYFFKKIKVEQYEKAGLDEEINRWLYSLAKEIGITTDF